MELLSIRRDPADRRRKTVQVVRSLQDGEQTSLRTSIRHLQEFETWEALTRNVQENHRAFLVAVDACRREAATKGRIGELKSLVDSTINRELVNVVTSFKLCLDHTRTRLIHRFGPVGPEMTLYKRVTSASFDNVFEYRFVCQLRDYVVHCGFPIENIAVESSLEGGGSPVHKMHFAFDPKQLLEKGPTYWRGRVKKDLQDRAEPFAVEPVLDRAISELQGISLALSTLELPHLHSSVRAIWAVVGDVFGDDVVPALGNVIAVAEGAVDIELLDLPARMMERLGYLSIERD
jgi:hypothetical protein